MASKGPRSKLDHETRARRQKALEAPKEHRRPKTHWDHVLEEMVWLSKDFESERKWKLAQAKKAALRASKGMLDQATRGEKRVKEEEQRLRKVALNISKDVKKFWLKIEKLVLYKHQLELDEKKKKALDKQLEFLLGQTERYSTMLAENLVSSPGRCKLLNPSCPGEPLRIQYKEGEDDKGNAAENIATLVESQSNAPDIDEDYDVDSEDELEDDEHTLEEDEAYITKEDRDEELAALQDETDLPLEELLKRYAERASRESSPEDTAVGAGPIISIENGKENGIATACTSDGCSSPSTLGRRSVDSNGFLSDNHFSDVGADEIRELSDKSQVMYKKHIFDDFSDEQEDEDFDLSTREEECNTDDETTLSEEEKLAEADTADPTDEILLLHKESEIPVEELLSRYKKDSDSENEQYDDSDSMHASASENFTESPVQKGYELKQLKNKEDSQAVKPTICSQEERGSECREEAGEGGGESENRIADAAAAARLAQPTGNTFLTTKVRTKFPFLLKYPLREYQHIGLDWLVTMYEKKLNGILADEMGLGKTIMTIALLAHLACEKGIWGPHLIVVPTSVMLNWETEFLKWCPAFKILTYFGSAKERRIKRQGWLKPNSFHVCITTYRLVIQDSKVFKRKKWKYLILDEAHLIKNWKSQRWQTLLNFNSKRRILLTGTPLQNNLMELWSLMHFLMPHVFQSHQEFKDWFSNPISGMVEGQEKVNKEVVDRLHNVLRPFILRRLKRDVEKQLPTKQEHVIYCRLSKRQRNLYEDFIASSETQATLASSNFFGMISVIMQLRKVCNHPDLFEGRPIISSFDMSGINMQLSSSVCSLVSVGPFSDVDINGLGFQFTHLDMCMASWESEEIQAIATPSSLIEGCANLVDGAVGLSSQHKNKLHGMNIFAEIQKKLMEQRGREAKERAASIAWWNSLRCKKKPIYSTGLRELVTVRHPVYDIHCKKNNPISYSYSSKLADMILSPVERFELMANQVESFMFAIPAARAPSPVCWCCKGQTSVFIEPAYKEKCSELLSPLLTPIRPAIVRRQVYFPDRRLIQFDCGKLQELAILLRRLKLGGHRALIFTQMTKMLDILEAFINLYGYTYMRLDGSTPPEERQTLMQRFNTNPKIFIFILSTRSGGVGINLVGADTVIFYDSDWNPAMDQQAQDRCHRIGQTREVHIYRLISESTIEENILKKANQKRVLDDLVIQSGGYNTEFLKKLDPMELFSGHKTVNAGVQKQEKCNDSVEILPSNLDLEAALKYAEDEADYMALKKVEQEEAVENQEFTEEAIGRLEDDDLANDEDMKADEHTENGILTLTSNGDNDAGLGMTSNAGNVTVTSEAADTGGPTVTSSAENGDFAAILNKDGAGLPNVQDPTESQSLTLAGKDDDFDMLADVKEMAAAAAASGQTIISFENQLRPIDRYAIRFMELWDPIIDKTAVETQVQIDEKEWELDRIEKLKEDMEADIDDDEEPLVYESWDADFATEVYRQQVEALAQLQLQEELEAEAKKKELAELGNSDLASNHTPSARKPKSKKKAKKTKFKSMKKGALASEFKTVKEESQIDSMSLDEEIAFDEVTSMSDVPSPRLKLKKRKQGPYDDEDRNIKNKKFKKASEIVPLDLHSKLMGSLLDEPKHSTQSDSNFHGTELKSVSRSKLGGKISITSMPVKRILTIKPEKLKKKGNVWSKDCFPSPDFWSPHEDAVLCATVQEYGSNWRLVGEILYGMTAGGFYRGRYRHPVHCCERFRDLIQRHVLSGNDTVNNDKVGNASSGKGLLKVTEDNIKTLVDVASQLSDPEPLVQKHFFNLFSSVWRVSTRGSHRGSLVHSPNSLYSSGRLMNSSMDHFSRDISRQPSEKMPFTNLSFSSKLVASALSNDHRSLKDDQVPKYNQKEEAPLIPEKLDVTLELLNNQDDKTVSLPALVNLSILEPYSPPSSSMRVQEDNRLRSSQNLAANRFRDASRVCAEDCMSWASLAFPTGDAKSRNPVKSQSLGKHKLLSDSTKTSRGKMRKTAVDSGNVHNNSMGAPVAQPPATISNIFRIDEDLASSSLPDVGIHELYWISPFDIDDELASLTESTEMASHEYVPSLMSGLDDYLTLPEFADIG